MHFVVSLFHLTFHQILNSMIITSIETVPGKEISESVGLVRGSTVRARNIGRDIFAGFKNLVGGEISEYTKLQAQSRDEALQRMIDDASRLGADAVVNVRFSTANIVQGVSEILAYGTAVKLK
jgi:uncharacterized protein YbjQ (UPF0145 family)